MKTPSPKKLRVSSLIDDNEDGNLSPTKVSSSLVYVSPLVLSLSIVFF